MSKMVEILNAVGFVFLVLVSTAGAWLWNLVEIFQHEAVDVEFAVRLIGIFVWPVGSFMGLFW